MKPIIFLAIIAIAGITLSTGFLGNEIELWIQQFGVGSGDIQTPIDHVQVDFFINQRQDQFNHFKNLVEECELTLGEDVGQAIGSPVNPADPDGAQVTKDSELTCKFTDENGDIIAENTIGSPLILQPGCVPDPGLPPVIPPTICPLVPQGFFPAGEYVIPIGEDIRNIHDVVVVVHANVYSIGDFDVPPLQP